MIKDDIVALMMSVAYTMPYLDGDSVSMLGAREALELMNMDLHEIKEYIRLNGVKTTSLDDVQEDAYILCRNTLFHMGTFGRGSIPSELIAKYGYGCKDMAFLHTHPIPLPVPTLEDVISMQQIGYSMECVLSRVGKQLAEMVCIELLDGFEFDAVALKIEWFSNRLYGLVDRYVIAEEGDSVLFLPYPSIKSLRIIENEFASLVKGFAKVNIVTLDMGSNEYEYLLKM